MTNPLYAQQPDQTLSPYFLVKSKDSKTDQMPLKHTSAEVSVAGVIADVTVKQVYQNEGKNTLEAIYVFPGSTRAAVYAMTMTIGERKLVAKIEEKEKARQDYEKAKEEGKTASLLEQQNPNVFQMNVANILPGDKITVELHYTELLVPTAGVYEFVYPTVVGPRYSETPVAQAKPSEKWVANPYLHEGEAPNYTFDIRATLQTGVPIQDVTCTSHQVAIQFPAKDMSVVQLKPNEKDGGNRDYILKYRLAGGQIQSGLLLYEGENAVAGGPTLMESSEENENFFLLMMQPPKAPTSDQIPPREYVFIVDVSGSMNGFPLDISKKLLRNLISNLRPTDRFNVMLFESSNQMMSPESMPATEANIQKAIRVIDEQRGGGGTRLLPALKNALSFKETKDYSRSFVVITDGYVTVEREAFDLIRNNLNEANLFSFGIGSSVNRFIIDGMAKAGMGEPFVITKPAEADAIAEKFRNYIQNPVLTNIQVAYQGFQVYDVEPVSIPDVFAERPIVVYGKYKGRPTGTVTLTGLSGNNTYTQKIMVSKANSQNNQALRYLWARKRIEQLDDYSKIDPYNKDHQKTKEEVTRLGLKYNLLTAYTSFIAIDPEARNKEGDLTTVNQPLPLPQGVSDKAVGGLSPMSNASYAPKKMRRVKREQKPNAISSEVEDISNVDEIEIKEEKIKEKDKPSVLEKQAQPLGGMKAFYEYIKQNLQYPADAKKAGVSGEVMVEFTVNADGSLSDFKVVKGLGHGCDAEALRLLKQAPKWRPAQQNGKAVSSKQTVMISFKQ